MQPDSIRRTVPILAVKDLTRAIAFYNLLGFAARRYQNGDAYAFLSRGNFEIHLSQSNSLFAGHQPGHGIYFYLASGTAPALEAEFRSAGAPILSPLAPREWQMNEFVVADPDANLLRFGEDLQPSA